MPKIEYAGYMNEGQFYDPMSVHAEVDDIYAGADVQETMEALKALSMGLRNATRKSLFFDGKTRPVKTIHRTDLFGEYLNNNPTAQDEITIIQDS